MNRCEPEDRDTKECGNMLKIFSSAKKAGSQTEMQNGVEGENTRVTRKQCKRLREEFEVGGFMAQKGSWNIAKQVKLKDRGAPPKEEET